MDLQNKVIAITGGASGLGEATLRNFVAQGAKVAILDLNADNANKLVDELGSDNVLFINTNIMILVLMNRTLSEPNSSTNLLALSALRSNIATLAP